MKEKAHGLDTGYWILDAYRSSDHQIWAWGGEFFN